MSDFNDRLTEAFALHNVIPDPLATKFYRTIKEADDEDEDDGIAPPDIQLGSDDQIRLALLRLIMDKKPKSIDALEAKMKTYKDSKDNKDLLARVWVAMFHIIGSPDRDVQDAVISRHDAIKNCMSILTNRMLNSPHLNISDRAKKEIDSGIKWLNKERQYKLLTFAEKGPKDDLKTKTAALKAKMDARMAGEAEFVDPNPTMMADKPGGEGRVMNPNHPAYEGKKGDEPAAPPEKLKPEIAPEPAAPPEKLKPEIAPEPAALAAEPNDVEIVHTAGDKVMARILGIANIKGNRHRTIKYATFDGPTMAKITDSSELTAQNIHKYIHTLNDRYKKQKAAVTDPEARKKLAKQYTSMYTDDNVSAYGKLAPAQPPTDNFEEYLAQMTGTSLKDGVIKALDRIVKGKSILNQAKAEPKNAKHAMSYLLSANDDIIGQMLNEYRPKLESVPIDDVIDRLNQTFANQQKNNTNMESKLVDLSVISEVDWGKPVRNAKSALGKVSRWYNNRGRDLNAKDIRIAKRLCLYDMVATQIMLNPTKFYNDYLKPAGLGPKLKLQPAKKKMQPPAQPDEAGNWIDKEMNDNWVGQAAGSMFGNPWETQARAQTETETKSPEYIVKRMRELAAYFIQNADRYNSLNKNDQITPSDVKELNERLKEENYAAAVRDAESDLKYYTDMLNGMEEKAQKMGYQPEEAAKPDEPQAQPQRPAPEPSQVVKNLAGRITGLRKRFKSNPRLEVMIAKELPDIKPRLRILATLSVDQLVKRAQSDSKTWMKLLDDVEQLINKMDLAGIR